MGHSRAAAVANVLGAYLINEGKEPFVYTFACPNTTTASDADNYKGIFNVVNGDDLIPKLPLASWGFCRYGTDRLLTVSEHSGNRTVTGGAYKGGAFKAYFGINYNNNGKLGLLLDEFSSVADDRDELYVLTMEEDTLSINGSDSDTPEEALIKAQEYMSQHPPIFGQLGIYTSVQAKTFFGSTVYRVGCYQTPAYFMQTLAYLAANEGGMDVITGGRLIPVADKYTNARNYFVLTYLSGMSHPHWCETYYLIASGAFEGVYPRNG